MKPGQSKHRSKLTRVAALSFTCVLVSLLGACTPDDSVEPCFAGQISRVYLGQSTPNGTVTDAQWQQFITESVTPRFPRGFTVLAAEGQWRGANGEMQHEATRVLEIAHDHNPYTRARVHDLANDYKRQFAQQSVLVTQVPSYQCS
jgi:Protein of unknown function (DUF3574)